MTVSVYDDIPDTKRRVEVMMFALRKDRLISNQEFDSTDSRILIEALKVFVWGLSPDRKVEPK